MIKLVAKYINKIIKIFDNNLYISLLLFLLLSAKVLLLFRGMGDNFICLDGWYYSNIARSIIEGHGYSNPFGVDTGPTAWVPPFLTFLFIPIFKLIGDNSFGFLVIDLIQMLGFSLSFFFLLKTWDLISIRKNNIIIFLVFLFYIYLNQLYVFRQITDFWDNLLMISLSLYGLLNFIKNKKSFILLLFTAFFIPLTSPTIAPWFTITLFIVFITNLFYKKIITYKIVFIGIAFTLSLSIWSIRNYYAFNKIILSKSNMWFEFYLVNIKDDDGMLSMSTIKKYHPDANVDYYGKEINEKNEVEWLNNFKKISKEYLNENKEDYLFKVLNRAKNAFVYMDVTNDLCETEIINLISVSSKDSLIKHKLIKDNYWVSLNYEPDKIMSEIKTIAPNDYEKIYQDWSYCKTKIFSRSLVDILFSLFVSLIPILCLIYISIRFIKQEFIFVAIVVFLYVVYLIPYILISHEIRYQQPLIGIQILLLSLILSLLFEKCKKLYTNMFC
jgi:hypothetical protein